MATNDAENVDYVLVARRILPDGWRHSIYRRPDGSTFQTAAAPRDRFLDGEPTYQRDYNEEAETVMAERLARIDGDTDAR
mgnify:CR=1 FL=1